MYIPRIFKNENEEDVKQFLIDNSFGILVTSQKSELLATHIPLELEQNQKEEWVLQGHIALGNPQKKHFEEGTEVLAIFNGPLGTTMSMSLLGIMWQFIFTEAFIIWKEKHYGFT